MFDVRDDVKFWVIQKATEGKIDPDLALSIARTESDLNPYVVRYEPRWAYFKNSAFFSKSLSINELTEKILQSISWGPMQVMGAVCRELGYDDHLTKLGYDYQKAIDYGIFKLAQLLRKYPDLNDAISSFNQGSPIKNLNGLYRNQEYVDNVRRSFDSLKQGKGG